MEWHPISAIILYLLFVFLSHTIADLISDREALLDFAASVPHGRKLFWNSTSSVCSWVGVTCTAEGSRVLSLRLPGIGLHGPVPSNTLGKLDALTILSLRSNALSGKLPSDIISLPSLQYMYLQDNRFSGSIPSCLSSHLTVLDLSFNSFTGSIPPAIQNLTRLMVLSLQNNSLSGSIPVLELPKLRHLNLSYNHLNGSIPSAIHNFPAPSFEGNDMLCGKPLNPCSTFMPAPSPFPVIIPPAPLVALKPNGGSRKKLSTRATVAIAVGGSAVLFLLLLIFCCCQRRKDTESSGVLKVQSGSENPKQEFGSGVQEAEKNKLIFFQGSTYSFDLEDLLRASAEVLGKGSYGTAYKAILEDGTIVVVKRLKELVVGKREFEQQMEIVGRLVQHQNIVPLRAYYYSKDEKLLVYDYISAGNPFSITAW